MVIHTSLSKGNTDYKHYKHNTDDNLCIRTVTVVCRYHMHTHASGLIVKGMLLSDMGY